MFLLKIKENSSMATNNNGHYLLVDYKDYLIISDSQRNGRSVMVKVHETFSQ